MKKSIAIVALLLGVASLVAVLVVSSFGAYNQIATEAESRQHVLVVIEKSETLLIDLINAETGERGYALTGDESFLQPYESVKDTIIPSLDELALITRSEAARDHLDTIGPLIAAKLAELSQVIEVRRNHDMAAVLATIGNSRSKKLMESIRAEIAAFISVEKYLVDLHTAAFQAKMSLLLIIIAIISVVVVLFALAFAFFIYRETQYRLKNFALLETRHLLDIQEETNKELEQINGCLQVSEEKLSVTLSSIGDAVLATDNRGRITLLNPAAEKLTGWTQDEASGIAVEDVFKIINQETRLPARIPVAETLAKGTIQGLANHTVLIARGGGECSIADSCSPIRAVDGTLIGTVLVFRDVTQEYAIQKKLQNSSVLIQTILDTVADGIITLHANDGLVRTVNPAALSIFGYSAAQLVGQRFQQLIPELELTTDNAGLSIGSGREVQGRRRDGHNFPVEMTVREMWIDDQRHFTCVLRDITARREIETGLKNTHEELQNLTVELERAARAKSEFLANMSHELRTPLNSIIGFSEVLFDEALGPLNPKQRKFTSNVLSNGKHLLQLINQILDMSKIESGKMSLSLGTLSPIRLLAEMLELTANMAASKHLNVDVKIPDYLPDIEADELKVKEIIYNLLSNAVKFTPDGGTIGVRARQSGPDIEVLVWDSGIGIAPENADKIFEGFFRVDTPFSQITEGTGLGLPLSKKLVELHNGALSVDSKGLGKGTSVRFTLPILAEKKA